MSWARCRMPARPTPDPVEPTVGRPSAVRGVLVPERNAADQRSALRARGASRATSDPRSNPHPMRPDPDPTRPRSDPTPIRSDPDARSAIRDRNPGRADRWSAARGAWVLGIGVGCSRPTVGSTREMRVPSHVRSTPDLPPIPHPIRTRSEPDPNPGRADRRSAARGVWVLGIGAECSRPTVGSTREMCVPSHARSASDPRTIRTRSTHDPNPIRVRSAPDAHPICVPIRVPIRTRVNRPLVGCARCVASWRRG
jgi:hypothetical protein